MIANIKSLKKYCSEYTKIENYDEAVKSPLKYDLHHRLEISEMQSVKDLIFLHLYYNRPPEELIFLEHGEHCRLHKEGENNPMFGKNMSAESRQKMSEAHKGEKSYMYGKPKSAETKQKMSEAHSGKHWHLENGYRIYTD